MGVKHLEEAGPARRIVEASGVLTQDFSGLGFTTSGMMRPGAS